MRGSRDPSEVGAILGSSKPEWVMVGRKAPDQYNGVVLIASRTLTTADLDIEYGRPGFSDDLSRRFETGQWCTLRAEMDDFVVVLAPTYAEALAELFKWWKPDDADEQPLALGPGRTAIDHG